MEIKELKTLTPVRILLPTKQYPHILGLLDEIEYPCGNCSSAQGKTVFRRLIDSYLDPISGPGKYHTRLGVYCPDCKIQCKDYGYVQNGIVDLLQVDPKFKAPKRSADTRAGGIFTDEDDAQPLVSPGPATGTSAAKISADDDAPITIPAKPKVDPGPGNILVYDELKGWHVIKAMMIEDPDLEPKAGTQKLKGKKTLDAGVKAKKARLKAKA